MRKPLTEAQRVLARERNRRYGEKNRDKLREREKAYRLSNPARYKETAAKKWQRYYQKNRTKLIQAAREYHWKNREKVLQRMNTPEAIDRRNFHARRRRAENPEDYREWRRRKQKEWLNSKPVRRVEKILRDRLSFLVMKCRAKKFERSRNLCGCTLEFLCGYIAAQFKMGMTWDNHGLWHLDHIVPCSQFNLLEKEDQLRCFHYTNLQPLWASDNLRKSNKVVAK